MKLRDFCTIKVGLVSADFWIVRRGSRKTVGMPVREFNPEHFGVVVFSSELLPDYLFLVLLYIHSTGVWEVVATGSTYLVNIRKQDILDLPVVRM
jgi:hypothetical protein